MYILKTFSKMIFTRLSFAFQNIFWTQSQIIISQIFLDNMIIMFLQNFLKYVSMKLKIIL